MLPYLISKLNILFWTYFYRLFSFICFTKIGKNCYFEGWIDIPQNGGKIILGNNVRISRRVEFTVRKNAILQIGDNVFIGKNVMISCHQEVTIGKYSLLAEYVTIHDNDHDMNLTDPVKNIYRFIVAPVIIGEKNWLGSGAKLLKGVRLGNFVIVGAGAVVTKSFLDNVVIAGVPANVIKEQD